MSRIGLKPIPLPEKIEISEENSLVKVKGALGELAQLVPPGISFKIEANQVMISRGSDERQIRAYHGLFRALLNNMIKGVSQGFEKALQIVGVGYRVTQQGDKLQLLIGYSKPVSVEPLEGVKLVADGTTRILVKGIDKQRVNQVAANIRALRPPDAYKGKGIRYEGEKVVKKAGKTAAK